MASGAWSEQAFPLGPPLLAMSPDDWSERRRDASCSQSEEAFEADTGREQFCRGIYVVQSRHAVTELVQYLSAKKKLQSLDVLLMLEHREASTKQLSA